MLLSNDKLLNKEINMHNTQVKELMTEEPAIISDKATLQEAAEMMAAIDWHRE